MSTTGNARNAGRWALAVVLVLGVLGMHALVVPPAVAGSGVAAAPEMSMPVADGLLGGTTDAGQPAAVGGADAPMGGHSPAGGHSMLTTCLAVLASLAALGLLVAAALARHPAPSDPSADVHPLGVRSSPDRPPPWTVPSLHQLSLLRV